MAKHNEISTETQDEAQAVAKKTQKPGQTKEQTRLIAQGIQKGIAEYKKVAKSKQRLADKANKKNKKKQPEQITEIEVDTKKEKNNYAAWILLVLSWIGFASYIF